MKRLLVVMLVGMMVVLSGCGALSKLIKPSKDIVQDCAIIQSVSETATLLVLKDKSKAVATAMLKEVDEFIIPMLINPEVKITNVAEEILFAKLEKIDMEYKMLMGTAFLVLNASYESPSVGKILTDDGVKYLIAFFNGIKSACELKIQ